MFDSETLVAAARAANELGVPVHHLLAVAEVESAGRVYARVAGRNEPLIRFEGHYFDKRIVPHRREAARKVGLASPKVGGVKNPAKQEDRWKLVERAAALDKQAAFESVSWGLGQVMGAHWRKLGYGSVLALVDHARKGAGGQIELMARFIKAHPALKTALAKGAWKDFAKGYNGPGYAANAYDVKMAKAAKKWAGVTIPKETPQKPADEREPQNAPGAPTATEVSPVTPASGAVAKIVAVIVAAGAGALAWLANLPCSIFGIWCGG